MAHPIDVRDQVPIKLTKGERTAQRLMDVAEKLFAERGFDGTTLRDVATAAEIREPGIYNHFASKVALYGSVLERGLGPMLSLLEQVGAGSLELGEIQALPSAMTDLLAKHPHMPALFQQALMSPDDSPAHAVMREWLDKLFAGGQRTMGWATDNSEQRRQEAIRMVAMFNLCTGYFLSQRVMDFMGAGDLLAEQNLAEQKKLLAQLVTLIGK